MSAVNVAEEVLHRDRGSIQKQSQRDLPMIGNNYYLGVWLGVARRIDQRGQRYKYS